MAIQPFLQKNILTIFDEIYAYNWYPAFLTSPSIQKNLLTCLLIFQKELYTVRRSVDYNMLTRLVIVAAIICSAAGQEFQGYDCNDPTHAKFYRHDECSIHKGHLVSEDYYILQVKSLITLYILLNTLQENTRRNMTATKCEIFATTRVGYCGHYRSGFQICLSRK